MHKVHKERQMFFLPPEKELGDGLLFFMILP
jgi:hypothetical protein